MTNDRAVPTRLDELIMDFIGSPWGALGADPARANGECKFVSLKLLTVLRDDAIPADLWNMSSLIARRWGGPGEGQHYVVAVGGEALDLTARQFLPSNAYPLRESLKTARARWRHSNVVNPNDAFEQRVHNIPPHWMSLPDPQPSATTPGS